MQYISPITHTSVETEETEFGRDDWKLVRCRDTGFVFLPNPPDYSELGSELAWEKTATQERDRRIQAEPTMSKLSAVVKRVRRKVFAQRNKMLAIFLEEVAGGESEKKLTVLDIGCGEGGLLLEAYNAAKSLGLEVMPVGVEVSKELARVTHAKMDEVGGKVINEDALGGVRKFEEDGLDVALMSSFLEHEKNPYDLLKALHGTLTDNGSVILKVPNFDCWNRSFRGNRWCGFRYPDHVNYFTPETLDILANATGFKVSRQNVWDRFPTSDNMYAVLKKKV